MYGKELSQKHKNLISKGLKNSNHPIHKNGHSEETKEKIKSSKLGTKLTEEHKNKISKAISGRTLSPEHCKKISEAKQGTGHHLSKVTKSMALKIYKEYNTSNITQQNLSDKFNIAIDRVCLIVNHNHWTTKDIPEICRLTISEQEKRRSINKEICFEIYKGFYKNKLTKNHFRERYNLSSSMVGRIINHKHWSTKNIPKMCRLNNPHNYKGYRKAGSDLTVSDCFEIYRYYHNNDVNKKEVSNKFPTSYDTVLNILNHKHWATGDFTKEEILRKER